MKLEETQALYDFLGRLSWFGILALFILVSLIVAFTLLNILDKLFDAENKKVKRRITFLLVATIFFCGIVLKVEADHAKRELRKANTIISYMVERKQRYRSMRGLALDITLNPEDTMCTTEDCITKRIKEIKKIVEKHPDQFIKTPVDEDWKHNAEGLELIDEKAGRIVDSALNKMLPYYQDKIIYYMMKSNRDTLSYGFILDSLDGRCYPSTLDMVIVNSQGLLIATNRAQRKIILNKELLKSIGYLQTKMGR